MQLPINYETAHWTTRRKAREAYIIAQKGRCFWCHHPLDDEPAEWIRGAKINWALFPLNFLKYPVHLHHCHETGMTEGAVHAFCNAYMWQYHGR